MATFEDEFQKPVRERLAAIVIPDEPPSYKDWPQHTVPETDYDAWFNGACVQMDLHVAQAQSVFDEITHAPDVGVLSGRFPSPRKRKRTRSKS